MCELEKRNNSKQGNSLIQNKHERYLTVVKEIENVVVNFDYLCSAPYLSIKKEKDRS